MSKYIKEVGASFFFTLNKSYNMGRMMIKPSGVALQLELLA